MHLQMELTRGHSTLRPVIRGVAQDDMLFPQSCSVLLPVNVRFPLNHTMWWVWTSGQSSHPCSLVKWVSGSCTNWLDLVLCSAFFEECFCNWFCVCVFVWFLSYPYTRCRWCLWRSEGAVSLKWMMRCDSKYSAKAASALNNRVIPPVPHIQLKNEFVLAQTYNTKTYILVGYLWCFSTYKHSIFSLNISIPSKHLLSLCVGDIQNFACGFLSCTVSNHCSIPITLYYPGSSCWCIMAI